MQKRQSVCAAGLVPVWLAIILSGCSPDLLRSLSTANRFLSSLPPSAVDTLQTPAEETLKLSPGNPTFPTGQALSITFSGIGGISPYSYSVLFGPGSINSTTGMYSSSIGQRNPGDTTTIQVTDANGDTATSQITHRLILANGYVRTTAGSGTDLYLGGDFTTVNPHFTERFLALNTSDGEIANYSFTSGFSGGSAPVVNAIVISGNSAYIGGTFTSYKGTSVQNLVKVDTRTGALDTTFTQSTGPDNTVSALLVSGNDLYVGGDFTAYRGDDRGYRLLKLNATTGALDTTFNSTSNSGPSGQVYTLLLSGMNLYVGGNFTSYRGDNKGYYLAKVDSTSGVLDTTDFNTVASSGPNSTVQALALSGSYLYVGGPFTTYRGDNKGYRLAKVNATTGVLDTTNFNTSAFGGPNSAVYALVLSGSYLYVGGGFTQYRSDGRGYYLARVNATTGALDTTDFNTVAGSAGGPSSAVRSMALSGSDLYISGDFTAYRSDTRGERVAKVNATTGALDIAGFNASTVPKFILNLQTLALSGSTLYLGGYFATFKGDDRGTRLAKMDVSTGALDATFNSTAGAGPNNSVSTLVLSGGDLYVGGSFTSYRGDNKGYRLAKVNATTGAMDTASFNTVANSGPNSSVYAMVLSGSWLYIGGFFSSYRGDTKGYYLARVDVGSGALDTTDFNAIASSGPNTTVYSLALSGSDLYVGGNFTSYRGDTKGYYLARVNATSGVLDTTNFNTVASFGPNAYVKKLLLSGGNLYIGGNFTSYRGDVKGYRLARVSATTGALDTTDFNTIDNAGPNATVETLVLSGANLYAGGSFTQYRGDAKGYYVAKVDATSGALDTANFNTTASSGPNNVVYTLGFAGADLFVGGAFTTYRGASGLPYFLLLNATTGVAQ